MKDESRNAFLDLAYQSEQPGRQLLGRLGRELKSLYAEMADAPTSPDIDRLVDELRAAEPGQLDDPGTSSPR